MQNQTADENIKSRKIVNILIYSILFILFCLLIIFTFSDLKISQTLYEGDNFLTKVFMYIGKAPGYLVLIFSAMVLFKCNNINYKAATFSLNIIYILMILGGCFLLAMSIIENFNDGLMMYAVSGVVAAAMTVALLLILSRIEREKLKKFQKWSFISAIVVIITFCGVAALKILVSRFRYIDVLLGDGAYAAWYNIRPFGNGDSFPSGHTALFACAFLAIPFLELFNPKIWVKYVTMGVITLALLLCAYSRVMGGYHYMTDVTVSIFMYVIIHLAAFKLFNYKNRKQFDNGNRFEKIFNLGV